MLNPLRSEPEAFRLLMYVIAVLLVLIAIALILRAAL
jgi:predicted nucleic acid-binding Zn ribbon protein